LIKKVENVASAKASVAAWTTDGIEDSAEARVMSESAAEYSEVVDLSTYVTAIVKKDAEIASLRHGAKISQEIIDSLRPARAEVVEYFNNALKERGALWASTHAKDIAAKDEEIANLKAAAGPFAISLREHVLTFAAKDGEIAKKDHMIRAKDAALECLKDALKGQPPQLQHALHAAVRAMKRLAVRHRPAHDLLVEVLGREIEIPAPKHLRQPFRLRLGNPSRTHPSSPTVDQPFLAPRLVRVTQRKCRSLNPSSSPASTQLNRPARCKPIASKTRAIRTSGNM
jgi:hypothetical protein